MKKRLESSGALRVGRRAFNAEDAARSAGEIRSTLTPLRLVLDVLGRDEQDCAHICVT
jgi:hypothetical protein